MIEEISVGIVVAGAGYFIIRKILHQLAGEEAQGGCQGCSGCSIPESERTPEMMKMRQQQGTCPSAAQNAFTPVNVNADEVEARDIEKAGSG